ncbi:AIR synthase-related protein [Desulfohalovibrio reitneri]|uniref:AIR synthase-related protein n=1 Tax=Desulfohalovibrio reitneri TaxID=1307759 RepID=UPI0004A74EA9|nr:AIR synthase-related protein [Desulfohalovibrio reitneri]
MPFRVHVGVKPHLPDTVGRKTAEAVRHDLHISLDAVRVHAVYTVDGLPPERAGDVLALAALHDPVLHQASTAPLDEPFDWLVEVSFRPGVTDNEGRTAASVLRGLFGEEASEVGVYTSRQYLLRGAIGREEAGRIGTDLLANELIHKVEVRSADEGAPVDVEVPKVTAEAVEEVASVNLAAMSDEGLMAFSRDNVLALTLEEMRLIRDHYAAPATREKRAALGLPAEPTDAELECLAQTWSEHCKHKIFNARIDYRDEETGERTLVDSLFKTHIAGSTEAIRQAKGEDDLCLSVFKDNAGVFKLTDEWAACIKVETHNSPSALDPYGGALTGIVGVNRDPMGTGLGANLLCNTDVFCFASPFYDQELPPRLLHPRRVMEGVREGVEHGGNKSGIPTVNGSIVFDERYLGKPLVYCGTVGMMPTEIGGRPAYEKYHKPGDAVVMAGGRIGKDGIHGATFSSEELHEGSPATAVQIGDPITQRKMYDFLMRARDLGLYSAITDNGAGGLSSSVGEMAEDTGGARIDLARAPLKYAGLRPWEILLSEAQERMTLAVPPENLDRFLELAGEMDVECSVLGEFTDSGRFDVFYNDTPVAALNMEFLHHGLPQMELSAVWKRPQRGPAELPGDLDLGETLKTMLSRLNVCSKESVVRQYDHEVQGGSVIKPMVGVERDGPGDSGVIRPLLDSEVGLAVSHGICPKYSDFDTYDMMACAIDEAVRNAVAAGADPDRLVGVDNFCWCDPVKSEKTPDGEYKLAQLVRACRSLDEVCRGFGVPCISGKDSMKNDYTGGGRKISIPPTVLFSVCGILPDVNRGLSSDFKKPGEAIYLLGETFDELGGGELAQELGITGGTAPKVDAAPALARYRAVHKAAMAGLVTACHDCSDGGLACCLAEMALGGRLGAGVDLDDAPRQPEDMSPAVLLFSESASRLVVTVPADLASEFESLFQGQAMARLGVVINEPNLSIRLKNIELLSEKAEDLAHAFKKTLLE